MIKRCGKTGLKKIIDLKRTEMRYLITAVITACLLAGCCTTQKTEDNFDTLDSKLQTMEQRLDQLEQRVGELEPLKVLPLK
jgi:outer membrane murein-binding lipoprotein Lpp